MNKALVKGVPAPVFVAGIKYSSLFSASIETAISTVSFYKAFNKNSGEPCKIKKCTVVLESWVLNRVKNLHEEYGL